MKEFPEHWNVSGVREPVQQVQGPGPVQTQTIIKEVVREIIKIPCQYCGTLVENTVSICPECKGKVR